MTVREIMYSGVENAVVDKNDCFRDALEEMNKKSHGVVSIVDGKKIVGLLTDGDVRRILLNTQQSLPQLFLVSVSELMIQDPKTVFSDISIKDCLKLLQKNRFWVIPVVNKDKELLGLVHLHTLLNALGGK